MQDEPRGTRRPGGVLDGTPGQKEEAVGDLGNLQSAVSTGFIS